jgi:hypothetical protein
MIGTERKDGAAGADGAIAMSRFEGPPGYPIRLLP